MKFTEMASGKTWNLSWALLGGYWICSTMYFSALCLANWEIETEGKIFYTDDVAIFSASQRLSAEEDPTQPALDVTDQGHDWAFEPEMLISQTWATGMGNTRVEARGQGFLFADHTSFNHATFGMSLSQDLPFNTLVNVRYHFGPRLFLGRNIEKHSGTQVEARERVTTHFGAITLEKAFLESIRIRIFTRYGARLYNETFSQRDTRFWTLGPHVAWRLTPTLEWVLRYHFERGQAEGRKSPALKDDVSYVNHYLSSDLEWRPAPTTLIGLAIHYERNLFTSDLEEDERNGAHEDIIQGDLEIRQEWIAGITLIIGGQFSRRKASFETDPILNTNVWIGGHYAF